MIKLTRFDKSQFLVNEDFIETIEATPDTVVSLSTGKKFTVRESVEEIMNQVMAFRRQFSHVLKKEENGGPDS